MVKPFHNFPPRKLNEESLLSRCIHFASDQSILVANITSLCHLSIVELNLHEDQRLVYLTVTLRFFYASVLRGKIKLHE